MRTKPSSSPTSCSPRPARIAFYPLKLSPSPSSPSCSNSCSSGNVPGMEQRRGREGGAGRRRRGRRGGEGLEGREGIIEFWGRNPFEEAVQNAGVFLQSSLANFGLEEKTKRGGLAGGGRGRKGVNGEEEPSERRARGEPVVSGRKFFEGAVQNAEAFLQSSFAKWGLEDRAKIEGRSREQQWRQTGRAPESGFLLWGSNPILEEAVRKTRASVQSSLVKWGLEERIQRGRRRRAGEQLQRGRVREAAISRIRYPFGEAVQNAGAFLQSALTKWTSGAENAKEFIGEILTNRGGRAWDSILPLPARGFCSTSIALAAEVDSNASAQQQQQQQLEQTEQSGGRSGTAAERRVERTSGDRSEREQQRKRGNGSQAGQDGAGEERVLISEILIQDKNGQDVNDAELLATVRGALKACKPNFALTTTEVQEDVHRIINTGFFASCMPSAEDTRDGVRLIFKVEPNEELKGLVCNGANALPTRVIEDAFRDEYGKVVNIQRLNRVLDNLNGWYRDRGLFGQVTDVEILPKGVIRVQVAEAEVNNINIRFLDRKTGEPTTGKTQPETLLRQLTTKKGQVYSLQQGRRDVETVFTMGIMEDVNLVPQAAGDTGMVDLTMNVVERVTGGFSAGGGLSGNGITNGALSGLVGSFAYSHRNAFGRNQKLNISLERGQVDSMFRVNYTDPWIEGDDKRTSRSVNMQNSRSPGTIVHGIQRDARASDPSHSGVTIGRLMAGVDYSRPLRPKWSGTAGIHFQRAGARDDHGEPKEADMYGGPITFSGRACDDMLVAKLESVYTDSSDNGSSQLVCNTEQGLPIAADWLFFNRINVRARQGLRLGPLRVIASFSGGTVMGDLAPHEAFPIGGTNSVRGYDEGAVGSGRSCLVGSAEISLPLYGPVEGALFGDYGTDLKSGKTVPGDPAGVRGKPGSGFGYGAGIRVDSPLGPLRLEYAFNDNQARRFHFGIGYRN